MKRLLILCLFTAFVLTLTAQQTTTTTTTTTAPKNNSGKSSFMMTKELGVTFLKFGGLDNRIKQFPQYEGLESHMYTLGLGSMHVMNNFISSLSVTGGSSLSGDRDRKSSALRYLSGALDLGYDVIPSDRIMLFPMVGIGAETYHAIFYKDNASVDFDDVLEFPTIQNNIRSVKFTNKFVNYRAGLGVAFKSNKHPGFIGLKAYYSGSIKDDRRWKSAEYQDLDGGPVDEVSRFQISLVFGSQSKMMMN